MDLGQVFTTREVADYMVDLLCLEQKAKILDPCFGEGAFLKALQKAGYTDVDGYEIDAKLFLKVQRLYFGYKLCCKDFLSVGGNFLYDGIVMNPPYIRQEKIDALEPLGVTKEKIRKNKIYKDLSASSNLYMYFILKAVDLLKQGGTLVAIFPSSWMQARSGLKFKQVMESACGIEEEIHIRGEVFEKEALVEVVILKLRKGILITTPKIIEANIQDGKISQREREMTHVELGFKTPFAELAAVRRGLTTGCNQLYINPDIRAEKTASEMLQPIISSPKNIKGFSTKGAKADLLFVPQKEELLDGSEEAYYLEYWKTKILTEEKPKTLYEKIKSGEDWYQIRLVDSRGIWFGYFIRNEMKFVLNTDGCLARDNFYVIAPQIDERLMFALLNNFYTFYQLEELGKKYGAGLLKLQRYDIEALKFPKLESVLFSDRKRLEELADKLVSTGEWQWIDEITKVLARYSRVSAAEIKKQYQSIQERRLKEQ